MVDESTLLEATVTNENCDGEVTPEQNEMVYCRMPMTATNLTVLGREEPWDSGNETIGPKRIFKKGEVGEETQREALKENDHMYRGGTIERGQTRKRSTAEAAERVEVLGTL